MTLREGFASWQLAILMSWSHHWTFPFVNRALLALTVPLGRNYDVFCFSCPCLQKPRSFLSKTVCIGKRTRHGHFTLTRITDVQLLKARMVFKKMLRVWTLPSVSAKRMTPERVWHDRNIQFRTPKATIQVLVQQQYGKSSNEEIWSDALRAAENKWCAVLKCSQSVCCSALSAQIARLLIALWWLENNPFAVLVHGKRNFLLGWRTPAAWSHIPCERGERVQVQDVDAWVSCCIIQLQFEQHTTGFQKCACLCCSVIFVDLLSSI